MILEARKGDGPKTREFLVKFTDGHEDCWLSERDLAQDLIDDFDAGRELAEAEAITEQRLRGDTIDYLIRYPLPPRQNPPAGLRRHDVQRHCGAC